MLNSVRKFTMQSSHGSELPPETDKPPVILLSVFIVILIGIMVAVGLASKQLLWAAASREIEVKQGPGNPSLELSELHAAEDNVLGSFDLVDKEKGWYRIPIDNAIEEFAKTAEK